MVNVEELPPRPFLDLLADIGLETRVREHGLDLPVAVRPQRAVG
jgi:hypothetical protein